MLRACVIDLSGNWDDHLPLIEFSYNNSRHSSLKAAPYQVLYGRRCRTPVCWGNIENKEFTGPELINQTSEKVKQILERLQAAQDRQKSYAGKRRKHLEFEVGEEVLLNVAPWKGLLRFGKRGKLSPRYIGPFSIIRRVGTVAYQLELPSQLQRIHNTFHISNLRKCLADEEAKVPLEEISVNERLHYKEEPEKIIDQTTRKLRNKEVALVKIQWKYHKGRDATWENEEIMKEKYPHLFQ